MSCNVNENEINDFIYKRLNTSTNGSDNKRIALVLVGGPGGGKSSIKAKTLEKINMQQSDFVNVDPDEILTGLFANNETCREPVNKINNQIYDLAIQQNKNIIFDGTGRNFDWYSTNVLKKLKENGYAVNLAIVINNVDTVLERIKRRADATGRDVDLEYTKQVYSSLDDAIPKYVSLSCDYVNARIFVYDNKTELRLIYQTHCDGSKMIVECLGEICKTDDKVIGGKRKSRRNIQSKKSQKGKSRTNRRKSNRRRR